MTTRRIGDLLFLAVLGAVVVYMVSSAQEWPSGARLFPTALGIAMGALLLLQLAGSIREIRSAGRHATSKPLWPDVDPALARRRALSTLGAVVGFALAVWLFGFPIGAPLALAVHLLLVMRERVVVSVAIVAGATAFLWAMSVLLRIPFADPAIPFLSNPF